MNQIEIRYMQHSDIPAAMQLKNAEKWNQTEQDWQFLLSNNPNSSLVATHAHQVVGTVTAICYQQQLAWIGMMLVQKEFRGQGISKLLLNNVLERLDTCHSVKLDATPAGIPVYKKLGFAEEYELLRMTNSSILNRNELGGLQVSPITKTNISSISKVDETWFGAKRDGLFHYLHQERQDLSWKITDGNQVLGYIFGRNGSNYVQIGPLMARSPQLAQVLLAKALSHLEGKAVVVDVLADKKELINRLLSLGFVTQRTFKRMYLHSNEYAGLTQNHYLISGPELG